MRNSAPASTAATSQLQPIPAAGPFFQHCYGELLELPADMLQLPLLAGVPTTTRERLIARAHAHWQQPSLSHYAHHELHMLECRLPVYEFILDDRFDVGSRQLLRAIKFTAAAVLKAQTALIRRPHKLDMSGMLELPQPLRDGLVAPLIEQLRCAFGRRDRQPHRALTAWLAAMPQLLAGLVCSTPQAQQEMMQQDLVTLFSKTPLHMVADLLPNSTYYDDVYFPTERADGTVEWNQLNGVVCWRGTLILLDIDTESECLLAQAEDFEQQLRHFKWRLQQPAPCIQFRRYMESAREVILYTHYSVRKHIERARLHSRDFQQVIHLSVTSNDMLAQLQRLRLLSRPDNYRSLTLSLHELMCYRELLDEPQRFIRFLQQRLHALGNPYLRSVAELDHLAMHQRRAGYAYALDSLDLLPKLMRHPHRKTFEREFARRLHERLSQLPPSSPNHGDSSGLQGRAPCAS